MRRCLALLVVFMAITLSATSVIPMTVEQLTTAATHVVRAQAVSSESRWDETHSGIYTFTTFHALETWKGAPMADFVVRQMGGRVAGVEQKVSGVRSFQAGDEAVLFLRPSVVGNNVQAVVGLFQGNFTVERTGAATAYVSNGVPGVMQFDPATQRLQHFRAARIPLSELHSRVARAMGQ